MAILTLSKHTVGPTPKLLIECWNSVCGTRVPPTLPGSGTRHLRFVWKWPHFSTLARTDY